MNEIKAIEKNDLQINIDDIRKYIAPSLNEQELYLFVQTAKIFNLNPIKREIYAVKYGDRFSVIVGYQVYLERVSRENILEYWEVDVEKPDPNKIETWVAIFKAKRRDWAKEFNWKVPMREVNKKQSLWLIQPEFQLKKVAIAQGLRMLCPEVFGGFPYIAEEIGENDEFNVNEHVQENSVINNEHIEDKMQNSEDEQWQRFMNKLKSIETASGICQWYKKLQNAINRSSKKEQIEAVIKTRFRELASSELATKLELNGDDIQNFLNTDAIEDEYSVINEILQDNEEETELFISRFANYMNSL